MESLEVKDKLNFSNDKNFRQVVQSGEHLLWSGEVLKTNKVGKIQRRDFLITTLHVYNIGKPGNFLTSWFSKRVRRTIRIERITAMTLSGISNNFVLHVPQEYDYYLTTNDRDEFLSYIFFV